MDDRCAQNYFSTSCARVPARSHHRRCIFARRFACASPCGSLESTLRANRACSKQRPDARDPSTHHTNDSRTILRHRSTSGGSGSLARADRARLRAACRRSCPSMGRRLRMPPRCSPAGSTGPAGSRSGTEPVVPSGLSTCRLPDAPGPLVRQYRPPAILRYSSAMLPRFEPPHPSDLASAPLRFGGANAGCGPAARRGAASGAALPRVHLFATGGTISNKNGGRLTVDELIASVPSLDRRVRATGEQFLNVASGQVTMEQWLDLARRINEKLRTDKDLAGVVVTSGTDTLEELAYFLHLTVRDERPCVVVGAMRNPEHAGLRRRRQPRGSVHRGGRPRLARHGRARRAQQRNQLGARSHENGRQAVEHVQLARLRRARHGVRPRAVFPEAAEAAYGGQRVRRREDRRPCRAWM